MQSDATLILALLRRVGKNHLTPWEILDTDEYERAYEEIKGGATGKDNFEVGAIHSFL